MSQRLPARLRGSGGRAWLPAAIALFAVSVTGYWLLIAAQPGLWSHSDEYIYRAAGALVLHRPSSLYQARLGAPGFARLPFTYPPFAALLFAVASRVSFAVWQVALVIADLALLPAIALAALRVAGRRGRNGAALAFALAAVALWLEPVFMTMFFGQINLILLALVLGDLAVPGSSRWKGIGIGLAAGLKLTPLIFIPYLLASGRVRAAVVSLLAFLATLGVGLAVLPTASGQYWTGALSLGNLGMERLQNQSLSGVVRRLAHGSAAATPVWLVLAAVVGAAGLATAVWASRRGHELLGIVTCGVTGLLISPISWSHHWVWVVPGLALLAGGTGQAGAGAGRRARAIRLAGVSAVIGIFAMWPAPDRHGQLSPQGLLRLAPHGNGLEFTWQGPMLVLGNLYVLLGAAAIAGSAAYLWATRHGRARAAATVGDQSTSATLSQRSSSSSFWD